MSPKRERWNLKFKTRHAGAVRLTANFVATSRRRNTAQQFADYDWTFIVQQLGPPRSGRRLSWSRGGSCATGLNNARVQAIEAFRRTLLDEEPNPDVLEHLTE